METQQLLDALADHLAIYHRNSAPRTESRERQKVIEWLVGLNHEQRQAALTVVDGPWVAILLSMQKYLVAEGRGFFFLLPDVPGSVGETLGVELRSSKHNDGKVEKNTSDSKSRRHLKLHRALGSKGSDRVDKGCTRCSSTLPGLCFRRARGLVGRLHREEEAGDMLVNNIRLFSSEDGEAKVGLGKADAGRMLDCISITDDLLNNLDTFFGVMDDLSHHEFLRSPCHFPASPWEEMPWLKDMGYYGLEAFIANKFEFALWSAWRCAQGTKRPPRLLALKLRDAQAGKSVRSCSCDLHSNAGLASSIIRKKLGCINWWCRLARKERAQMIKCTLAMACKSEVLKLVGDAKASSSKLGDVNYKGKNKLLCMDTGETRLKSTLKASLSDSEVDQQVTLAGKSGNGATVVPFLIGLQALKELSESGLLCGKSEGISPVQETDASWLFDSTLKSAHTLSDRVLRKVRNVLVKVRNDRVEIELLGDENSGNLHSSNGGENSQVKSTKSKKKRRKQSSSHKVEVVHQDEKLPSSKLKSVKGQEEAEKNLEIELGTVEKWSSGPQQLVGGSKSTSSTQQSSSRKGKGGKLKSKKVERLHQDSKLQLKTTDMNGKEDSTASDVSMQGIYGRSTNGNDGGPNVKVEHLDEGCNLGLEKSAVDQYQGLPTSNMENGNGSHRKSSNRKGRGCKSKSRLEEVPNASLVHITESVLGENERPYASTFELNVGSNVREIGQGDARKVKLNKGEKLRNGFTVRSSEVVVDVKDELLSSHVEKNGGSIYLKTGKAVGTDCVENGVSLMASTGENHEQSRGRPEYEDIAIFHKSEESYTSRSTSQGVLPNSVSGTCDTCLIEDVCMLNRVELNPQKISSGLSEEKPCQNGCVDSARILGEQKGNSESAVICFGTFDTVLPAPVRIPDPSHLSKTPVKVETPTGCITQKGKESWDQVQGSARAQVMDLGNWSEGASHSRYIRSGPKGLHPPTKTSRQLEFPSNGLSHYQQGTVVRSVPHEWPGSVQVGFSGVYNQPTASDWLQLDVGRNLPPRMQSSLLTYRSTPVSMPRGRQADTSSVTATTRPMSAVNQEWPSFVQYLKGPPALALPVPPREESRLTGRPPLQPSQLPSGSWEVEANGGPALDLFEIEDKFAYDTDVDDYGVYKAGDFDDFDGYLVSEEEGERSLEDVSDSTAADYNQIFGGGVMYWNAADYAGMGYSRPGSLSSEDSSWARHEADLSVVLDDIVNYPLVQGGYSGKGPAVSNVTSSSPPSSSSLPVSFEHVSPVATSNSRHGVPRHVGNEFPGKFSMHSNPAISSEEPTGVSRVSSSSEVIEKIRVDNLGQPILRPIVVVRDITLSRQVSSGEALRLQEAKSPHIVPRSKRDFPGHRKRPPSPVLRCVLPAPPPPPPSPVAGPRRRKGFVAARSGSSSPRHWGLVNWPYKDETDNTEGKAKGGSPEGLIAGGRRRVGVANNPPMHPLSGTLLRERLIAVPPLALEQEHPDSGLPMKTTLIQSTSPALHHALTKLLKVIHMEIDAFCFQVAKENKRRRPFVNTAVKKVAHSLQVLWPRSRTKIFGSIATGLALPTSDVDLVVCLPPVRNLEPIKEAGILEGRNGIKETCLQHAARYLADQDWVKIDSLKTIENTLVPIIILVAEFPPHQCEMEDEKGPFFLGSKLRKYSVDEGGPKVDTNSTVDLETIDSCKKDINASGEEEKGPWGGKADRQLVRLDISFEAPSHTGLRTAELVRELIGQFPALSPLALVLKQFLTDRSLDHPYTGGLSSYCLVLLITRFLQHQSHLTNLIHNGRQSANQNLGSLFVDFLHFFGCVFDPRRMGVRIRGGGMYLNRDRFHGIDPLYIEDPLHPDNNVGRNCFRILQCVKAFADAYAVFEKKLHVVSNCSVDVVNEAANLELLQTILPGLANA